MPPKLSVNINKYALVRNSRGRGIPDLLEVVDAVLAAGAHGITVHPRLDQRHVRLDDVPRIAAHLRARHPGIEYNIECQDDDRLLAMVREVRPDQCTLVPVRPGEVTSDHGWTLPPDADRLRRAIDPLREAGIRTSCFADADSDAVARFSECGTDRVELYTGPYSWAWGSPAQERERERVLASARAAAAAGMGVNAGHDLDRHNLAGLRGLDCLDEVSIGHAHVCRALEVGTARSVGELLAALGWTGGSIRP